MQHSLNGQPAQGFVAVEEGNQIAARTSPKNRGQHFSQNLSSCPASGQVQSPSVLLLASCRTAQPSSSLGSPEKICHVNSRDNASISGASISGSNSISNNEPWLNLVSRYMNNAHSNDTSPSPKAEKNNR